MKRILFAAAAFMCLMAGTSAVQASGKTDTETLKKEIADGRYNSLLTKYLAGEQLSPGDAATVYYGSALQPRFNASADTRQIMESYATGQLDNTFRMCEKALESDPTNLAVLFKAYACAASSNNEAIKSKAPVMQNRLLNICDAIFASGTGVQDADPYVVIRPADIDEFVVKYMQPTSVIGRAKIGNLEAVKVKFQDIPDDVILYFSVL
ncbi:MAG: DUF4919 domain-containing protein [Bacteroides sp.]|nr:DUF4919 domain-containing protein [Bacteroides sp.]MCM1413796.1 DUF4919 domain-containing protein [Bacteroides sp.]MCM1472185.1 DUF4919 domain-containing protein [Bacteroides sp.]